MCGIAGYFGTNQISEERIQTCLGLMGRRGPDQAAARHFDNGSGRHAHLLFSRLAIIDLDERANQPFTAEAKWIVFNGELYNYRERRADLAAEGVTFHTESDTEVMLQSLHHHGLDSLDKGEGMWAFALYDEKDGSLTLCRDRFGEKPLYVYRDASGLYFGSEVKFIVALLSKALPVNYDHLYRYLVNGYRALYKGRHAFFQGVDEVAPGSSLVLDHSGRETAQRYWSRPMLQDEHMSYDDAVRGARERLIRSVELRLRADVPLAFCMSGGVDSNSLISIAKRVFDYDVHGFTILNTDARYEEQDMVDRMVQELKIRHTAINVDTTNFLARLRDLIRYHDAPVYTITYFAHWMLMESVHQHGYRISISGSAADELFTGYYDHQLAYLYEIRNNAVLHRSSAADWNTYIKPMVRNPFLGDPDLFVKDPGARDYIFLDAQGFSAYLKNDWREDFSEEELNSDLLRNRMANELFYETVPPMLHEDDLNAMYYSVENRSPFLDRNLFEFCFQIPTRHLIQQARAKSVLRDAVRGIVPDEIVDNRRKVGFNAPIFSYLDVKDPATRMALLEESPVFDHIRRDKIEALIDKPELPNSQSKFLFNFLNTKLFLEEFDGRGAV